MKKYKKIKKHYMFTSDVLLCQECKAMIWQSDIEKHTAWHDKLSDLYVRRVETEDTPFEWKVAPTYEWKITR